MDNVNISKVYLLDVPLENDYKNTLYFTSTSSQQSYFQNNIVFSFTDFSYQRKDHFIRVPKQYDEVYKCNYVMYQNSAYSNKWFYAFITDIKYVDDGRTDVYIETDVIQTWLFDYNVKASFVEREHVSDDTIGIHTIPEGLETGEYIINSHGTDSSNGDLTCVCATTLSPGELVNFYGGIYTGIPSGISYYRFDTITGGEGSNSLQQYLQMLTGDRINAVVGIFLAPKWVVSDNPSVPIPTSNNPKSFAMGIPKLTALDSYVPRNNKLLTYPYVYIEMSNGQGANAVYHQELWEANEGTNMMTFNVYGCLTPGCSIRGVPYNYKGDENPFDEGINLGKFPQINWTTDQYTNWLTQNGVNIAVNVGSALLSMALGVGMAKTVGAGAKTAVGKEIAKINAVNAIVGGVTDVGNTLGQIYQHSFTPPQAEGNINCGDVVTASGNNRFHYYRMSIKQEYAQIIDKYFDMFGYKVNLVKIPNKAHRSRWWYTKTIDVNIDGDIPNNDMQKIKNCYNNGITFWRNASEIQNYSLSNGIV